MLTFSKGLRTLPVRRAGLVLAAASAMALAACSGETPSGDASTGAAQASADLLVPEKTSLEDQLANADGLQTVAQALKDTGLASVFSGKGSYTLLAPEDATFADLGDAGKSLTDGSDNAAMAALLKQHMLTGYVTPQDIGAAIEASKDGEVKMPSLSGDELTFTKSGDTITVASPDGAKATFDGAALAGGESVAIPVSGLLRDVS